MRSGDPDSSSRDHDRATGWQITISTIFKREWNINDENYEGHWLNFRHWKFFSTPGRRGEIINNSLMISWRFHFPHSIYLECEMNSFLPVCSRPTTRAIQGFEGKLPSVNPRYWHPGRLGVQLVHGVGEFFVRGFHVVVFNDQVEKLPIGWLDTKAFGHSALWKKWIKDQAYSFWLMQQIYIKIAYTLTTALQ